MDDPPPLQHQQQYFVRVLIIDAFYITALALSLFSIVMKEEIEKSFSFIIAIAQIKALVTLDILTHNI